MTTSPHTMTREADSPPKIVTLIHFTCRTEHSVSAYCHSFGPPDMFAPWHSATPIVLHLTHLWFHIKTTCAYAGWRTQRFNNVFFFKVLWIKVSKEVISQDKNKMNKINVNSTILWNQWFTSSDGFGFPFIKLRHSDLRWFNIFIAIKLLKYIKENN